MFIIKTVLFPKTNKNLKKFPICATDKSKLYTGKACMF